MILKLYTTLLLLLVSASVSAQWSGTGDVTSIYSHNERIIVNSTITGNICGTSGKFWWKTSDTDSKDMLALAMTAMTAGHSIRVVYDENAGTTNCLYGGDQMTHIHVIKK